MQPLPPIPPDYNFDGPEMNGQPALSPDQQLLAARAGLRIAAAINHLHEAVMILSAAEEMVEIDMPHLTAVLAECRSEIDQQIIGAAYVMSEVESAI
jgi:hypothetical protein